MSIPATPQNFIVQTANGQVYLSWAITAGATSYTIQRSTDGITYATLTAPTLNSYLDTAVTLGTTYFYQLASVNGSGTSSYSQAQSAVPTTTGEMSLGQLRLAAQQRADRVNSQFVTPQEWNSYINQSMFELYDLMVTVYEDYFVATPAQFNSVANQLLYPLPNGVTSYTDTNGNAFIAKPFYKLMGVDLGLQTSPNGWVTVNKFNFIDRNRFIYPNTASTIYGVYNLQYRLVGNSIEFIPTPSKGQPIRLWYIPRLDQLLQDNDVTTIGVSGWLEYVIVKAAYLALTKEESDTSSLVMQLGALTKRIEESAMNRDVGQADTISDVRQGGYGGGGRGYNGNFGGF